MKETIILAALRNFLASTHAKGDAALWGTFWGGAVPGLIIAIRYGSRLPFHLEMALWAITLISSGLLIARFTWPTVQDWFVSLGNNFTAIHFLRDQFFHDYRIRKTLGLPDSQRVALDVAEYARFQSEVDAFRKVILDASYPSHREVSTERCELSAPNNDVSVGSPHAGTSITFTWSAAVTKSMSNSKTR